MAQRSPRHICPKFDNMQWADGKLTQQYLCRPVWWLPGAAHKTSRAFSCVLPLLVAGPVTWSASHFRSRCDRSIGDKGGRRPSKRWTLTEGLQSPLN
ncbi:hypothetical protein EVAR_67414_1 [Eumeta japonica]|uniref:Uncharacterized protein n=1 Tax=Eumeta variegata TaxID=151549 RepID=A0A4C2A5E4_EUMVA|nr:hypothetical protein EVAR_67414_1 [Eumeta japonica]